VWGERYRPAEPPENKEGKLGHQKLTSQNLRTRSFELGSTLLSVGHRLFGELLQFFDILHHYSLSNLCCKCF
jgi:hypothetical protein